MSTRKTEHSIADDNSSQALRQRAEEKACLGESSALESLTLDDARRMLHELQVHQIELEMQNEELRNTQHELESSRDSYFDLYDLAPVGYLTLSKQGLILKANLAAGAMFGMARRDLHRKPISSFFSQKDQDIYNLHRNMVLESDELQAWEMQMLRADGSPFWAKLRAVPAHNDEYGITVNDITVRKQAEFKLNDALVVANRFRDALDQLSGYAYMKDRNFCYIYANQPTLELFSCTAEELVGKDDSRFFPPIAAKLLREVDTRVLVGEHTAEEIEITDAKGERRVYWEVKTPIFADHDHKIIWGLCGISTDITERKLMEEAITNSNRLLQTVINSVPMRVFWKDNELRYLGCNISFANDAGLVCPDDLIGKNDHQLTWKEQAELYRADDRCVIESGKPKLSYDEPQTTPEGNNIWLRTSKVPLRNEANEPTGILGIYEDITERKLAEIELQKKNTEIEQFFYTVSHDLRSPLVTVKSFMGYLEKDMAEGNQEQLAEDIQFINSAADKMKLLLDELLEFSRIGRLETTSTRVSLMEVVADALDTLAGIINERKADIQLPETDLMLFGDRPRLCQIWQNLIENAIKYSRDDSIPRIELGVLKMTGEAVFFVKDNGIGIDPQYSSKIFGIFEKLNPKSPGAGMGLSLIQRIVEKCGGRAWVESEGKGQGCCFRFTLPGAVVQS